MRRYVVEDPVGHGGCDTPAPLMWRRVTPGTLLPGASDLTLFVPRAGGMVKAVAMYGDIPLFGVPSPGFSSPVDGLCDRIVHAAGDMNTGIPVGIAELVKIMVHTDVSTSLSTMASSFVSLCVPCGAAGVCGCNREGGTGAAVSSSSSGKSCGQIIVAPLWGPCDFDVWSTRLPEGLVPTTLCALDVHTAGGMVVRADAPRTEAPVVHGARAQFYSCRTTDRPPRVFLGECCARTFIQQYTRRVLRATDSLPHPNVVDPVFGHSTGVVHVPVYRAPQGAAMSSLAATYSTFAPCGTPRVVAVDRRTPGLASARLTDAQWARVHGGEANFLIVLTKSVAGCREMARDSLPARCTVRLAPMVDTPLAALSTPRTSAFKRVRPDDEEQAGAGAGGASSGAHEGGDEYDDEH